MRILIVLLGLIGPSALAVDLKYTCTGMWAGPYAILDTTATIQGSFNPNGSTIKIDLNFETGGHLTGDFSGTDGKYSQGAFSFDNNAGNKIHGQLTRVTAPNPAHSGFRFDSPSNSAIFSCTL